MKAVILTTTLLLVAGCSALSSAASGLQVPLLDTTIYTQICTVMDEAQWVAAALVAASAPTATNFPPAPPQFCVTSTFQANRSLAEISYRQKINQTGWNDLTVDSVLEGIPSALRKPISGVSTTALAVLQSILLAQAAGFGEAYVSYEDFQSSLANSMYMTNSPILDKFRVDNDNWLRQQIRQYALLPSGTPTNEVGGPDYWRTNLYSMMYFDGLWAGTSYMNSHRTGTAPASYMPPVSQYFLWMQNAQGDILDLMAAYNISSMGVSVTELRKRNPLRMGHCSALIKMTYNMSDIFVAHATWGTYNMMLRVFKSIAVTRVVPGTQQLFETQVTRATYSSYPSVMASIDDFYVSSKSLAITETSLTVFNDNLYQVGVNMGPNTVLYYMRAMAATEMADTGKQWVDIFGKYNSGTYNNQWMVVDRKAFTPYTPFTQDVLWVAEQMPGHYETFDASRILALGYFPSYNIPYMKNLFNLAGYNTQLNGTGWQANSYEECSRAQIFRRQANAVEDLAGMQYIMQYNAYQTDPASYGNPTNAVSSRGDLIGVGNSAQDIACWGAMDVKLVSVAGMSDPHHKVLAYNGPTPQEGAFSFSSMPPNTMMCTRVGMPDTYNFGFQEFPLL